MIGHEPLFAMRRRGEVPVVVWVTDGPDPLAKDWHDNPNLFDGCYHAHIQVEEGDTPELLDFRCVVGLSVGLYCLRGPGRANRLHHALIEAKAKSVVTTTPTDMWTYFGA